MEIPPAAAASCVDDVLITEELERRPRRAPDDAAENRAMAALARQLAADPHGVPRTLAELVLELCDAGSAGISLLEEQDGRRYFRWHAPDKLRRSVDELFRWYAEGRLRPLISQRLPLERTVEGIRLLTDRKAHGKIVVVPGG